MMEKEYAEKIAEKLGMKAVSVTKPGGEEFWGVTAPVDKGIAPMFYVREVMKTGIAADVAAEGIKEAIKRLGAAPESKLPVTFEEAKPLLRVRLQHISSGPDISIPAALYGLDDLVIVPYLLLENKGAAAACVISKGIKGKWGTGNCDIIETAIENTKKGVRMRTLEDVIFGEYHFGAPYDITELNELNHAGMYVLTTENQAWGAIAGILMEGELKEKFEDKPYWLIPSSIHEMLAVSGELEGMRLTEMIRDINRNIVDAREVLSNRPYRVG